jgi:antitoxin component YwqK of YwqJK toxin-antitoxin module
MKNSIPKFYSLILLFLIFNSTNAQKLSLADLHSMSSNKNWETSNKYLLSKGWDYNNSVKGDNEHYNTITWAYNKTGYETEKAPGWFYVYTFDGLPNKVMYRFRDKKIYLSIKQELILNKYKLQDEEVLDEKVIATYRNSAYILNIMYSRETNEDEEYNGSFTVYNITVYKIGGVYDPDNGNKKIFDTDGNLTAEYSLKGGEKNGLMKIFNPDGTIAKTIMMIDGFENGISTSYLYKDSTGILIGKYKGNVINDKKNGKWVINVINDDKETPFSYTHFINDIEEGDFREVRGDTVIYGKYKNGLFDGKYSAYIDLKRVGSLMDSDTLNFKISSVGQFVANKKQGLWKNYHLSGVLESEGNYLDSLKTGKWNYYYDKYSDEDGIEMENSRKLYQVKNYNLGKLNGESFLYYTEEKEEVECVDGNKQEKCYKKIFVKILEKSIYNNGVLNGPYEISNDKNEIMFKGQYLEGKESGKWIIRNNWVTGTNMVNDIDTGIYQQGKKQGKWERFDLNNQIIGTYNYTDDLLDGEQITFLKNIPSIKRNFDKGQFNNMTVFDSIGSKKTNYALYEISGTNYLCKVSSFELDKIAVNTYKVSLAKDSIIRPKSFDSDFMALSETEKVLDGYHEVQSNDNTILEQGNYENNIKNGTWSNYYYDQNVKTEFDYAKDGSIQKEYYYDLKKNEPFSGEFIFKTVDSPITEERKIKEGLRNGTTRFLDSNDKTIKKESYKDGVLKV